MEPNRTTMDFIASEPQAAAGVNVIKIKKACSYCGGKRGIPMLKRIESPSNPAARLKTDAIANPCGHLETEALSMVLASADKLYRLYSLLDKQGVKHCFKPQDGLSDFDRRVAIRRDQLLTWFRENDKFTAYPASFFKVRGLVYSQQVTYHKTNRNDLNMHDRAIQMAGAYLTLASERQPQAVNA